MAAASRRMALVALLLVVGASCGDETAGPGTLGPPATSPVTTSPVTMSPVGSDVDALAGTSWVAQSMSDASGSSPVVAGSEPTLDFGDAGRTVTGSTGCNSYSAAVDIGGGTLAFTDLAVTERGCLGPGIMDQEGAFLTILTTVDTFTLAGGILEIRGAAGAVSFTEATPAVNVPLSGTMWELETLIEGDTATSVIFTTFPTLTVDIDEGSMRGSTGCNDYGGIVSVQGNELTVLDMSWTEIACERDVMLQEGLILDVLQGARSFEIDGDRLTIFGPGDAALVYRAG